MTPLNCLEFQIVSQYAVCVSGMFYDAQKALNVIPFGTEGRAEAVAKLEYARTVLRAATDRISEMSTRRATPPEVDAEVVP
jgi:cob(I)alamin adenosyltransferase